MLWREQMSTGDWFAMVLAELVVWGLVITLLLVLIRSRFARRHERELSSPQSAREILDRRLASGEIDDDEYERIRRTLAASRHPDQPEARRPRVDA